MAEIKSTLDLVMEKTRNLTFSSEEKLAHQVEQARKAFNGFLQKYLDGQLELAEIQQKVAGLVERHELGGREVLRKAVADRLTPASMPEPLLILLEQVFGCDTEALRALGQDYRSEMATRAGARSSQLATYFEERHGVSGTAVAPNLEADAKWKEEIVILHELFAAKLEDEKARL